MKGLKISFLIQQAFIIGFIVGNRYSDMKPWNLLWILPATTLLCILYYETLAWLEEKVFSRHPIDNTYDKSTYHNQGGE